MSDLQIVLNELKEVKRQIGAGQKRLLTVDETATALGISPKTIRNGLAPKAIRPFPIKPVRLAGRTLFKAKEIDALVDGLGVE
jgi:hypothetical protein